MAVEERTHRTTISFLNAAMKDLVQEIGPQLALTLTSARLSLHPSWPPRLIQTLDAYYVTVSENFAHMLDWILVALWTSSSYTLTTRSQLISVK